MYFRDFFISKVKKKKTIKKNLFGVLIFSHTHIIIPSIGDKLYKQFLYETLARCLSEEDAYVALVKVHDGMENELGNGKQFFQLILKLEDLGNGSQIRKGLSSLSFFFLLLLLIMHI